MIAKPLHSSYLGERQNESYPPIASIDPPGRRLKSLSLWESRPAAGEGLHHARPVRTKVDVGSAMFRPPERVRVRFLLREPGANTLGLIPKLKLDEALVA